MGRKRCKLSKNEYEQKDHSKDIFVCSKCGRSAKNKNKLCKPEKSKDN